MSDAPTLEDELLARARIHAREIDLELDWNRLEWEVSARARRRAGWCRYDPDTGVATIVFAKKAFEGYDWETFSEVVRHELIHAWEFQRYGESGHGERFYEQAGRLDAPRHCERFTEPNYRLRCLDETCPWEANRHRASSPVKTPDRYRCASCGGGYEVEHVESGRTWTCSSGYGDTRAALGDAW